MGSPSLFSAPPVCEDCRLYFRDACPEHGAPTFIADSPVPARAPSRALLSLPQGLLVKERPQGGLGVWSALPALPRGCIFGPYQGEVLLELGACTLFSWAVSAPLRPPTPCPSRVGAVGGGSLRGAGGDLSEGRRGLPWDAVGGSVSLGANPHPLPPPGTGKRLLFLH